MREWQILLEGAELCKLSNPARAEKLYKDALQSACRACGNDSAAVGVVLVDYADFLEQEGRDDEAQELYKRIQRICTVYVARFSNWYAPAEKDALSS